ncbi:MAG: quinone oxidoreductase family protein, partial [Acidimicrobiia bacterium]
AGEVVIAVAAAGVNRADILMRSGRYHSPPPLPFVPGAEGSGSVVSVGAGVSGFAVGDRVLAMGGRPGFYAERVAVKESRLVRVPDGVDLLQAATMPVAWLSAWYCLRRLADLKADEQVLIFAAASGVGSAALQIARDVGARVIATAGSADKVKWALDAGAEEAIDHEASDVAAEVSRLTGGRGVEVVLDTVGGEAFGVALRAAGHGGRVVNLANVATAASTVDTRDFYPKNVTIFGFQITNLMGQLGYDPRPDLAELVAGLADGRFSVPIEAALALEDAPAAHRLLEGRHNRGKVVLTP